jgi:hypothetical protein
MGGVDHQPTTRSPNRAGERSTGAAYGDLKEDKLKDGETAPVEVQ